MPGTGAVLFARLETFTKLQLGPGSNAGDRWFNEVAYTRLEPLQLGPGSNAGDRGRDTVPSRTRGQASIGPRQ